MKSQVMLMVTNVKKCLVPSACRTPEVDSMVYRVVNLIHIYK